MKLVDYYVNQAILNRVIEEKDLLAIESTDYFLNINTKRRKEDTKLILFKLLKMIHLQRCKLKKLRRKFLDVSF